MQVSILIPAYNAERYIAETIESILVQTYPNFELLIIDDGSTDNTLAIIKSYAEKDQRIKVITQANSGIPNTLNKGIELSKNEWICRMDADDLMMPNRIERQLAFIAENPDLAVASSYVYNIGEDGKIIGQFRAKFTNRAVVEEYVRKNQLIGFHQPAVIMKKSVIQAVGGYRNFSYAEDLDLWNRVAEQGYPILVQPEFLVKYRIHSTSISVTNAKQGIEKVNWVTECMIRRCQGKPEPTWSEFLVIQSQKPWWEKLDQKRKDLSYVLYKAAVTNVSRHEYHWLLPNLLGALLLRPTYVLNQVISKLKI